MNDIQKILLKVIGASLFSGQMPAIETVQLEPLLKEGETQTVFPLLFSSIDSQIQKEIGDKRYNSYKDLFMMHSVAGICNFAEHGELHNLMAKNNLPYVAIKGMSTAMYYKVPSLRSAGDVDVLVREQDFERAGNLFESIGFVKKQDDRGDIHSAYKRSPISIWELHRMVNGIPKNEIGKLISEEINNVINTAIKADVDGNVCMVPDKFHHGLIMLLHVASHLMGEGIGLRHLCDWVVFVSSISDEEFTELFEEKLKSFGLWCFAQILTLLGIKYLNAPKREWAMMNITNFDMQLEALMTDIMNSGNFGKRDMNRYREIKYILDREEGTVKRGGIIYQGFKTLNEKVCSSYNFIDKFRILLPVGWVAEIVKYIFLLSSGKRKSSDTKKMLKEAKQRKKLYATFDLFGVEN